MKRSDWKIYRRFAALLRPHRGRLAVVLAASAAGPFLLAARIWLLKVLIDNVLAGHHPQLLPAVATAFAGIAVLNAAIGAWKTGTSGWVGAHSGDRRAPRALLWRAAGLLAALFPRPAPG